MAISRKSSGVVLSAVLLFAVGFASWLGSAGPVGDARPAALLLSHILTPLLAAALCWGRARRAVVRADRLGWLLVGAGLATWGSGSIAFAAYILVQGEAPYPSPADALFLVFVLPTLAGLVMFARWVPHAVSRLHTFVDGLVIAAGLLLLSWRSLLGAVAHQPGARDAEWLVTIAYPIVDVTIAAVALSLVLRQSRARFSMILLCLGLFLVALADTFYVRAGVLGVLIPGDGFWQAGYTTGFLLAGVAALVFPGSDAAGATASAPAGEPAARSTRLEWSSVGSQALVYVVLGAALVATVTAPDTWTNDPVLVGIALATAVLAVLREGLVLADAAVLRSDLESKVRARTRELDASRTRLLSLTRTASDAVVVIDDQGVVQDWNNAAEALFAVPAERAIGRHMRDFMPERFRPAHDSGVERLRNGGEPKELRAVELTALRADGVEVAVELSISGWDHEGQRYFTGILRDISMRRIAEASQARERAHMTLIQEVAVAANQSGDVASAVRVTLKKVSDAFGWPIAHAFLVPDEPGLTDLTTIAWHVEDHERFGSFVAASENIQFTRESGIAGSALASGQPVWCRTSDDSVNLPRRDVAKELGIRSFLALPIRSQDRLVGVLEFFSTDGADPAADELRILDVVGTQIGRVIERDHARHRLTQLALHDALTGLANRVVFHNRLCDYLARANEEQRTVAVLLLDLDGFKEVNDSLGHAAGDELLVEVARRLEEATRRTDTVARLGGDEFAVAVRNVATDGDLDAQVVRLLDALSEPFEVHGRRIRPMGSIGVALSSADESADMLLRNADLAMYDAKAAGKGRVAFFHPAMHEEITERLDLEAAFDLAVEAGELELLYRPVVSLRTGRVVAREALLRWRHPDRGLLDPCPIVHGSGPSALSARVAAWTIAEACRHAAAWRTAGENNVRLALSLSCGDLTSTIVHQLRELLDELDLPAASLEIQISGYAEDAGSNANPVLPALVALGVGISLDEFGTGNASFALLRDLSVRTLKIGHHLVSGLPTDLTSCALVDAMVSMGLALEVEVMAVGVETRDQLDLLRARGCASVQGPLLGEPLPFDQCASGETPAAWAIGGL